MLRLLVALALNGPAPSDAYEAAVSAAEADIEAGEFDRARERLAEAYASNPDPALLYTRAQVERLAGECEKAIALFEEFIEQAEGVDQADARDAIEECRVELDAAAPPETAAPPPPADSTNEVHPRPWQRDPFAATSMAVGLSLTVAGAVTLAFALGRPADPARSMNEGDYDRAVGRTRTLIRVGAPLLAVGGALIIAAAVRWGLLARKSRRRNLAWKHGTLRF